MQVKNIHSNKNLFKPAPSTNQHNVGQNNDQDTSMHPTPNVTTTVAKQRKIKTKKRGHHGVPKIDHELLGLLQEKTINTSIEDAITEFSPAGNSKNSKSYFFTKASTANVDDDDDEEEEQEKEEEAADYSKDSNDYYDDDDDDSGDLDD